MVVFRLLLLAGTLAGLLLVGLPLQMLARALNWRLAQRIPVVFCRSLSWALQITTHFHGVQSEARPQLVVANHVSWTDILALGSRDPQGFLAKREVRSWPVFGLLARLQGTVFVDRQRRRQIPATNHKIAASMRTGQPLVLFAEATTSDGTRIKRFHSSHFAAARDLLAMEAALHHVVVQPVAIIYARRDGLPLGRFGRSTLAWYGDMTLLPQVLRLLSGGPVDCDVVFCAPLFFERGSDRKKIAAMAQREVHAASSLALSGRLPESIPGQVPNPPVLSVFLPAKSA